MSKTIHVLWLCIFVLLVGCSQQVDYIVVTDTASRPYEYTNENNEFVGIDVEILAAIAKDRHFTYELRPLGWDAAILAVQSGQADAFLAGVTINVERIMNGWIFSDSYLDCTQTFVVAKDSNITRFEDLAGKIVTVKNGTAGMSFAKSLEAKYGYTVVVLEDVATMYDDVGSGKCAACVEDTPIMIANIEANPGLNLRIPAGMESESSPCGLAIMNAKFQPLVKQFNAGLKNIKASGEYQRIMKKYLRQYAPASE